MLSLLKQWLRKAIRKLSTRTVQRIFQFFLTTQPEVWIPLSRQSLNTIKISGFINDLYIDRFSLEEVMVLITEVKHKFTQAPLYFVTDSEIRPSVLGVQYMDQGAPINDVGSLRVYICAFNSDERLMSFLRRLKQCGGQYAYFTPTRGYPPARYFHRNDIARSVLIEDAQIVFPKFELGDFENILQALEITKHLEGSYVEIGVFQGRSAHVALNYIQKANMKRFSYFIDTYEGFSYPAATQSPDARWSGTHTGTSIAEVQAFLAPFLQKELLRLNIISDSLPEQINDVCVCNIDVDMYEAVLHAAVKIAPHIVPGGIIILEDQGHTPGLAGAYLATIEFLETETGKQFTPVHLPSGQMFLVKTRS